MKILSLDQASVITGYSIFKNGRLDDYGMIDLRKKNKECRSESMIQEIQKLIDRISPDVVVFEDVSLQSNPNTLTKLARIQGAIIGYCGKTNCPYVIYAPSKWRKFLGFEQGRGISRNLLKKQAVNYVFEHFNIEKIKEDICEAICIGYAYLRTEKENKL